MDEILSHALSFGIDRSAYEALRRLGIFAGKITPHATRFGIYVFNFSFQGDKELAKYHIQTFLSDEFGAIFVTFYSRPRDRRDCYARFKISERGPINAYEVKANARRNRR